MRELAFALGLVLVIEGFAFAAFPAATRRAMTMMQNAPDGSLRLAGLVALALGVLVAWVARGG
jgi:uncharacterized protein YjeT (DUF2065 family)